MDDTDFFESKFTAYMSLVMTGINQDSRPLKVNNKINVRGWTLGDILVT